MSKRSKKREPSTDRNSQPLTSFDEDESHPLYSGPADDVPVKSKQDTRDEEILKQVMAEYETEELPYRRISFYAYLFILIVIGIPVWWYTTTPYRASLDNFGSSLKINIPLRIRMYYEQNPSELELLKITHRWASEEISPFPHDNSLHLNYTFELKRQENLLNFVRSPSSSGCEVDLVFLEEEEFNRLKPDKSSEVIITKGRYLVLLSDNANHLFELVRRIVYEEVLDINRLSMIMQRERKNDRKEYEIRHVKPELAAWEDISISPHYNVHVVFIHADPAIQQRNRALEKKITGDINRLANLLSETTYISLSSEHFWDFSLDNFVRRDKNQSHVPFGSISDLVTEVDRYSAAIEAPVPTFKLAVVVSEKKLGLMDEKNQPTSAIAVASWGGIISICSTCTETKINPSTGALDVLRTLLGLRKTLPEGITRLSDSINKLAWKRFHLHAYVENQLRARHYVRAIHEMTSKISDLVVSDEVANLVRDSIQASADSNDRVNDGQCVDTYLSAKARIFAEKAANHPSLLEYLNFPWSQKYAIYLPLFFPVLLPSIEGLNQVIKAWLQRRKNVQRKP